MSDNAKFDEELIHPHCGNQALHLAEYCLATIRTFHVVEDNITSVVLLVNSDKITEAGVEVSRACLRMMRIALQDRNINLTDADASALAGDIISEAIGTGLTLHEVWSNRLDPANGN